MLFSLPKFDITTLQSLSVLASCSDDSTCHSRSINECNEAAPRGIRDLYKVLEAINSIPGAHKQTDSEANIVLDLVRAKCDVFLAQKVLADCIIRENEVLASLLKARAAAAEKNINETDIGLGCMRIIFKDHGWSHHHPNSPLRGQGQSSSRVLIICCAVGTLLIAITEIMNVLDMCKHLFLECPGVKLLTKSVHQVFFHAVAANFIIRSSFSLVHSSLFQFLNELRGTSDGCTQNSVMQFRWTSRKKVQTQRWGSGRYFGLSGVVIAVLTAHSQSRLNSFCHDDNSRNRPESLTTNQAVSRHLLNMPIAQTSPFGTSFPKYHCHIPAALGFLVDKRYFDDEFQAHGGLKKHAILVFIWIGSSWWSEVVHFPISNLLDTINLFNLKYVYISHKIIKQYFCELFGSW
ncbi:hypothetical protein F4604DRAFT_1677281 [Suillus subluteus]|nr:hypothetical protein F4604DRAFT_1677281 [Suillus subluteus]